MQQESARFFYAVGKRDVKDKWLKNTRIQDYQIFLLKSFELLEGQSCLAFLKEKDKENILKIDQIQREIEDIADMDIYNRSEQENAKIKAKYDKLVSDCLHDPQDFIPFEKTSKILGKTLLREAVIELRQIRAISETKERIMLHTEFEFQIEKIELPMGSNLQKSSTPAASKNMRIRVEKEFNPPKPPQFYSATLHPSNLKWIDSQFMYRMILRNNTSNIAIPNRNKPNKFEYALYFKNNFELIKVRDMIKSGIVLLTMERIKSQFKKLAMKWKSEVARGVYYNLDKYPERLTDRVLSSTSQKGQQLSSSQQGINNNNNNNRNSYVLNSSMSQDFTSNRASAKPLMFRNNLSLAENQLHFLGELEELKEKESQTNEDNQDERDQVIEQILQKRGNNSNSGESNNNKGRQSIEEIKENASNDNQGNSFDEVESVDLNKVIQKSSEQFNNYQTIKQPTSQVTESYESMPRLSTILSSNNLQNNQTEEINQVKRIQQTTEINRIQNESENNLTSNSGKRTKRSLMFGKPQVEQETVEQLNNDQQRDIQMKEVLEYQENQQQNNIPLSRPSMVISNRVESINFINKTSSSQQQLSYTKSNESYESTRQTAQFIDSQNISNNSDNRSYLQGISSLKLSSQAGQRQEMPMKQQYDSKNLGFVLNQPQQDLGQIKINNNNNDSSSLSRTSNSKVNVPLLQLRETLSSGVKQNQNGQSTQNISSENQFSSEKNVSNEYKYSMDGQYLSGNISTKPGRQQNGLEQQMNTKEIRIGKSEEILDPLTEESDLGTYSIKSEDQMNSRTLNTKYRTNFKVDNQNGSFSFLKKTKGLEEKQQQQQQNEQLIQVKKEFKQIKTTYLNHQKFKVNTGTYLSPQYQKLPEAKSPLKDTNTSKEESQSITMMDYLKTASQAERSQQKQTEFNSDFKLSQQKGGKMIQNKGQEGENQEVQEFTSGEEVSFYLQKIELICPTRDIAPQIIVQIELSLMNQEDFDQKQSTFQNAQIFHHSSSNHNINKTNNNGSQYAVHKWEDFIDPVRKIEDNYVYTVKDGSKKAIFGVSQIELYCVDVQIQNNPDRRVLGKIRVNLQDLLDLNEPGKDFWLLCPISLHSIPFALINLWTSLKSQCADFQEYNKSFYSQLQLVFHPHYNTSVHFPELKIEELERIAILQRAIGENDKWLESREQIERELGSHNSKQGLKTENIKKYINIQEDQQNQSEIPVSPLVTGEKYNEIKRALQYGFSNRMGFAQANLFIQENIYNSLFTKLQEGSLPQQEIARHFHQLCLEGIPYSQRQEIYLELLNTKEIVSNLRDNFVNYAVTNPAEQQNLPYDHAVSDIYLSTELNGQINEVHALLRDQNLMESRFQFYNVLFLEAQFYELTFEIDQNFPFADDSSMAIRVLTVLSFAMQISYDTVRLQFHSNYNNLLDKCLILNRKLPQDVQESEAFWLLFSIISAFNLDITGFSKYFHLFESSTNYNQLSNLVEVDGLLGLFSGSFHEELCFRCWDMIFMEEKRKTWDVIGYLTCIGIALCNKYAITTKTEWEVLGKYYTNFTELNRIAKETYESLLGNQRNCQQWKEKQLSAERLRSKSVERNNYLKQLISKVIQDQGLEFQMEGIENIVEEMLRSNFYAGKYNNKLINNNISDFNTNDAQTINGQKQRQLKQSLDRVGSKILFDTPTKQINTSEKDKYQQLQLYNTADYQTLGQDIDDFEGPALPLFNGLRLEETQENFQDIPIRQPANPHNKITQNNNITYKSEKKQQINNQSIQDKNYYSTQTAFLNISPGKINNNIMEEDKQNQFMKENLHFYIISLSETDTEQQQQQKQSQQSPSPIKTTKIRFNTQQQQQRRLYIGGREILFENEEVFEKYQFFESVERIPILQVLMKTTDGQDYSGTIDLRSFNRDTMYQSILFLISADYPAEITCQFTLYIESCSLKQPETSPVKRQIFIPNQSYQISPQKSLRIPQLLHNDICVNSSSTNEPLERNEAFEKCFNNQNLLECNVRHFIYGRNILTQNHRKITTETGIKRLLIENIVRSDCKGIFQDLLDELISYRDLNEEEDIIGLLEIFLLYTASSYERKLLVLFKLFQLQFPYQTSNDLESFILDFSMKLDISFLSIRDIQELLHLHEKNNFGITQAALIIEESTPINVTEIFTKIVRRFCRTYLLMSLDLNQSFLIEDILTSLDSTNQDAQSTYDGQTKFSQTDFKLQKGRLTVWYKIHSKVISQSVNFIIDSTGRVVIEQSQEQAIPAKAIFSRQQQLIRHKAICLQLAQCNGWINLFPITYIQDEDSFKQYVNNLHFLEQFIMKASTATVQKQLILKHPILLQVNYMETTQIFCDSVFSQSLVYKFHAKSNTINYMELLTLDSSLMTVLPRILGKSISFIKRNISVLINKKLVEDFSQPLKRIINKHDLDKSAGIINATLIDKQIQQQINQEEDDDTLDSQGIRNYSFNGYSLWKISSSYQYLPCRISQDNTSFKRDSNSAEYYASNQQEVFRWYS